MTSVHQRLEEYRKKKSTLPCGSEEVSVAKLPDQFKSSSDEISAETTRPAQAQVPLWLRRLGSFASGHRLILIGLKFLLYFLLQLVFAQLGFGSVFFVATLLFLLWTTMQSGVRQPHEPSAYSVFNPNCERLLGQTTADQFEQEIRHGYG